MKNAVQVFENAEFGRVRTIEVKGSPYFVGKDVAEILGYSNPRDALAKHVDDEDKNTVAIRDGIQGNPNMTIINESGLYSLILSSKLPTAKKFKRWVTSEVLPAIRKTGSYKTQRTHTRGEYPLEDCRAHTHSGIQRGMQCESSGDGHRHADSSLARRRTKNIFGKGDRRNVRRIGA